MRGSALFKESPPAEDGRADEHQKQIETFRAPGQIADVGYTGDGMTTSRRSFLRYLGLGAGAAAAAPVVAKAAMAVDGLPASPVVSGVPVYSIGQRADGSITALHLSVDALDKIAKDIGPVIKISADRFVVRIPGTNRIVFDSAENYTHA